MPLVVAACWRVACAARYFGVPGTWYGHASSGARVGRRTSLWNADPWWRSLRVVQLDMKRQWDVDKRLAELTEGVLIYMTGIYTLWYITEPSSTRKSCCVCSEDIAAWQTQIEIVPLIAALVCTYKPCLTPQFSWLVVDNTDSRCMSSLEDQRC